MALKKVTGAAKLDLKAIYDYISCDNEPAARKTLLLIEEKFQFLAENPHLHAPHPRYNNLSKSKVGNYLIFFKPIKNGVVIIRVIHAGRDIPAVLATVH